MPIEWTWGPADEDADLEVIKTMCDCSGRDPDDHEMHVTEGRATVIHTPCGLSISDYEEDVTLDGPLPVRVEWVSDGCDPPGGWHGTEGRCDCSYIPTVTVQGPNNLRRSLAKTLEEASWLRTVLVKANSEDLTHLDAALELARSWEAKAERLRTLLWGFVSAPITGSNNDLQGVAISHDLWNEAAEAVGYDEMGQ